MSAKSGRSAAALNASLPHPVVDADGHWLELGSMVSEQVRRIGGEKAAEGLAYYTSKVVKDVLALSPEQRRDQRMSHPVWWGLPTQNTRDRATVMMPRLLYERLDELGVDFSILYPTAGLGLPRISDPEVRRSACHAYNVLLADLFQEFDDRMTPVAVIPMHHPEEAIAELEHVRGELGLKVGMFGSLAVRGIPALADGPAAFRRHATWRDPLGLDSEYDYDPVWQRCVELGVSPTFHTGARDFGFRTSPSNFVYNHVGHFAAASEAVCKALFLGGVTRRFPTLKFAFLEGGVSWACQLYADLIAHWETRGAHALERIDPAALDLELLRSLSEKYGTAEMVTALRRSDVVLDAATPDTPIEPRDDFEACGIERAEDFAELFAAPFYFGCEAEDRMSAWAFDVRCNPLGARLNPMMGSDIGHFDVSDMSAVLCEAHELVDAGVMAPDDFRRFTFENVVHLFGDANSAFFEGTSVEAAAQELLSPSG